MIEQETEEAGLIRYALSSLFDPELTSTDSGHRDAAIAARR
jgi:hypothetical protein